MSDVWLYGIFALNALQTKTHHGLPLLELVRAPWAINAGILGALIVPFVAQDRMRAALTALGLTCLFVMTGFVFTALLMTACIAVFFSSRLLSRWSARRRDPARPLLVGWIIVHVMYVPVFFVIYPPFDGHMGWGEVTQFWGAAFTVLRSVHYLRMTCDGQVDPFENGAFQRFLLYLVHFASFQFGPFQKFRQFDEEVATCKQRLTWQNYLMGLARIGLGVIKYLIIFNWINRKFFYPYGYYGPLAEELFLQASNAEPGHLWLMFYLYVIRIYLFISGLSDGVIGMNLLMGIRVPENSRWPIIARDVGEFWRRYHIQMGACLRDEVFFAVGGAKNIWWGFFCVFAYCGLWHFPSVMAILGFATIQTAAFAATHYLADFWQRHERKDDWIHAWGKRLYLHDSLLSQVVGIVIVQNIFALSCLFVFDHRYGGTTMLPRMLGW